MNDLSDTEKLISELKTNSFVMGFYCGIAISSVVIFVVFSFMKF